MDPAVVAAIIAAGVSLLTLTFSVWAQIYGVNKNSADNTKTLEAQREQLQGAFEAQSNQLKSTLEEQSKQLKSTLDQERDRTLNERFATAAGQLGDDKPPAARLSGVYAMAGLADDWPENRQTCVDVLCAYLRLPYDPEPGEDAAPAERAAYAAGREVRHTVIRVITAHLKEDAAVSWQGLKFDFTGVVFDGGDFTGAGFSGGTVDFSGVGFSGSTLRFSGVGFSGSTVDFSGVGFSGGEVRFHRAEFSSGAVDFGGARLSGGTVGFDGVRFSGGTVRFRFAQFSGSTVDFTGPEDWSVRPAFPWTDTPPSSVQLPEEEDQSQA